MTKQRLSGKQRAFINEYLKCWNATKAAIKAGYSEKTAQQIGSQNLSKVVISEEIEKRVKEMCMSADEALWRLSEQARGDLDDCIIIKDGKPKLDVTLLKEKGKLHLIKSITPTAAGTKVELYSSQRALELIGKAQGLFIDRIDHTTKGEKITKDDPERIDRAISTFADAIGEILSRQSSEK